MSKKGSLVYQIEQTYRDMLAIGEKKHNDKHVIMDDGRKLSDSKIYSFDTFKSYMKHANYFAKWCKENYGCRTLDECRDHIDEWVQSRIDNNYSAYTIKLEVSALAKLYGCTSANVTNIETPSRSRKKISRSRGDAVRDSHFSTNKNADMIEFCRSTGLRRHELTALRGTQLQLDRKSGQYHIHVKGKGGRVRDARVCGDVDLVVRMCKSAGENKVFEKISSNADIHSYRADYAVRIYKSVARPLDELPKDKKYFCRGDRKGIVYDKDAMIETSKNLGHNRRSVVGEHYLYSL